MFSYQAFIQGGIYVTFLSFISLSLAQNFFCWRLRPDCKFSTRLSRNRINLARRLTSLGQGPSLSINYSKLAMEPIPLKQLLQVKNILNYILTKTYNIYMYVEAVVSEYIIKIVYIQDYASQRLQNNNIINTRDYFNFLIKMSDNNEISLEQHLHYLQDTIKQKNQIIAHLESRVRNQQKQIDMLVMDAQEKHFHQITKYYTQTYQKYMKHDRFLLIRVDDVQANGIFLPKQAKLVHFGQLQLMNPNNNASNTIINQQNMLNGGNNLKQINLNKNQSFQNSCKGLSAQIQQLKQKLKAYTTMVTNKSTSRIDYLHKQDTASPITRKDKQISDNKSIKKNVQTPINRIYQQEHKNVFNSIQIQKNNQKHKQKQRQRQRQRSQNRQPVIKQQQNNPSISNTKIHNQAAGDPNTNRNTLPSQVPNFNPIIDTNSIKKQQVQTNAKPNTITNNNTTNNTISQFPSPSPVKKNTTKRIFIRKN